MKSVSTNYSDFDKLSWAEVRSELLDLRGEEDFLVLFDPSAPDYVQAAPLENGELLVETRRYSADGSWHHYRRYYPRADEEQFLAPFWAFYHGQSDYWAGWADVSNELDEEYADYDDEECDDAD